MKCVDGFGFDTAISGEEHCSSAISIGASPPAESYIGGCENTVDIEYTMHDFDPMTGVPNGFFRTSTVRAKSVGGQSSHGAVFPSVSCKCNIGKANVDGIFSSDVCPSSFDHIDDDAKKILWGGKIAVPYGNGFEFQSADFDLGHHVCVSSRRS